MRTNCSLGCINIYIYIYISKYLFFLSPHHFYSVVILFYYIDLYYFIVLYVKMKTVIKGVQLDPVPD